MSQDNPDASSDVCAADVAAQARDLLTNVADPARLIECYYWSQEPGLLEFVRSILASPRNVRDALQAFFAASIARDAITASVDPDGALRLHSPEAAMILITFFSQPPNGAPLQQN